MNTYQETYLRKLQNLRRQHMSTKADRVKDEILMPGSRHQQRQQRRQHQQQGKNNNKKNRLYYSQEGEVVGDVESSDDSSYSSYESDRDEDRQQQSSLNQQYHPQQQQQSQIVQHTRSLIPMTLRRKFSRDSHDQQQNQQQQQHQKQEQITTQPLHKPAKPTPPHYHQTNNNPFSIPPGTILSPRADLWLLLTIACCVSIGSLADSNNSGGRSSYEKISLALSSLSLLLTSIASLCYRYEPARFHFTRTKCGETFLSIIVFLLVIVNTGIIMHPHYRYSNNGSASSNSIAIAGNTIWNTNLFYSTYIIFFVVAYIVGDLLTTENHFGTTGIHYVPNNTLARLWFLFIVAQVTMSGVTLSLANNVSYCRGSILESTPFCSKSISVAYLGFANVLLGLIAMMLHRLLAIGGDRIHYHFNVNALPMKWFDGKMECIRSCWRIGMGLATVGFILSCAIVGLISSPGGPGTETGSVFVTSWIGFLVGFVILKKYVEAYAAGICSADGGGGGGRSLAEESFVPVKQVRRFNNDGSNRSGTSRGTAVTALDNSSVAGDRYICDDDDIMVVDPFDAIEGGNYVPHSEMMMDDLKALPPAASLYSQQDSQGYSQASPPSDDNSPYITTCAYHGSDVSTLGISTPNIFVKEPVGLKSGQSHYGGVDAAASTSSSKASRSQHRVSSGHGQPQVNSGVDASGAKSILRPSFHQANMYPQQRQWAQEDESESSVEDFTPKSYSNQQPQNQNVEPKSPFARRNSYASIPNLSPLKEGSQEGGSTKTSPPSVEKRKTTKARSSKSPAKGGARSKQSKRPSKSSTKSSSQSNSSTLSVPLTEDDGLQNQGRTTFEELKGPASRRLGKHIEDTRGTTDFDILISESNTVVTELTSEGFDQASHHQPQNLPQRMPLYNSNDEQEEEEVGYPMPDRNAVDDLVASALAHARNSRSRNNSPAADDESGLNQDHYRGGGVSSGSGSKEKSTEERSEQRRQHKKSRSFTGHHKRSGSRSKGHPIRNKSEPDLAETMSSTMSVSSNKKPVTNRRGSIQSHFSELDNIITTEEDLSDYVC